MLNLMIKLDKNIYFYLILKKIVFISHMTLKDFSSFNGDSRSTLTLFPCQISRAKLNK